MKNAKIQLISTVLLTALLLTSCRENVSYGSGSDNGTADITEEQTKTELSEQHIPDSASTSITDIKSVVLDDYSVNENNILTLTLTNNLDIDLGYVFIFNLYKDNALLEYKEGFGICGTPDNFPTGETINLSFDLNYMFADLSNGKYDLEMEFKKINNFFVSDDEEVFVLRAVIELEQGNEGQANDSDSTIIWDNGDEIEDPDPIETDFVPSEFLIDYELSYDEKGNVTVYYQNNCNYEVVFGRYYELYDSNGNLVPFKDSNSGG